MKLSTNTETISMYGVDYDVLYNKKSSIEVISKDITSVIEDIASLITMLKS